MRTLRRAATYLAAVALAGGGLAVAGAGTALACVPDDHGGCYTPKTYFIDGTDGTLAVQRQPHINNVMGSLAEGAAVQVICQINFGGTADGIPSHTWDYITGNGWVYDHYVTTQAQDSHGFSPGVPHCASGGALTTSVSIPNLAVNEIRPATKTHVFNDGPGYYTSTTVRGLNDGGACQDFVVANTDFWWLWDSWDGYVTLNNVFTWPDVSRAYGRSVLSTPVVGAVVVFKGGPHGPYDYGTGHVAMVVKVNDSNSFTIAEYNWGIGGGGFGIMDYRRVDIRDGAVFAFIR